MSVIDSAPILRFHHQLFEDFLLSFLPKLSDIQDQNLHERQLATLCLDCMVSSDLHFIIYNSGSSNIKNVDIPAINKSAISLLMSYSSLFWEDQLVHTQHDGALMEVVEFVMCNKLLSWLEVMSILGKDTRPREQADGIYSRCPSIHLSIHHLHFSVLLKYVFQLFHLHPVAPSLLKNSAQDFQTLSPSVTTGLLHGR